MAHFRSQSLGLSETPGGLGTKGTGKKTFELLKHHNQVAGQSQIQIPTPLSFRRPGRGK